MASVNLTRYAILGVLNSHPASGYDIKKFCDAGIAHFWRENYGHLYPVLRQLENEKLIVQVKQNNAKPTGRNRILYQITEHGRCALKKWLTEPVQPAPLRLELLLKMTFSGSDEQAFMIGELERLRQGHQERRDLIRKILAQMENDPEVRKSPSYPYWISTARYGLQDADFRISWYEETGDRIRTWFNPNQTSALAPEISSAVKPDVFPASSQDWVNRIADDGSSWSVMQVVLRLNRPLDLRRLRQAARHLLDDEPVLSCRFDDACEPPVWRRLDLPDESWCGLVVTRNSWETIDRLISEPLPDSGQSWQIQLIRSPDAAGTTDDCLLIRAHHALIDAAGLRDLAALLVFRYRQQEASLSEIQPKPADRSGQALFAAVGSPDPRRLYRPDLAALQAGWGLPGTARPEAGTRPVYARRAIDGEQSARWLSAAQKAGVTVTALLLVGLGQALEELLTPEKDTVRLIQVTSNLRKFLPADQALILGNQSGMLPLQFTAEQTACTEQLQQIGQQLEKLQEQRADLHSAALLQLLSSRKFSDIRSMLAAAWQKSQESQHAAPILSNLGRWPDEALDFGESKVCDVEFYGPAMHAPALLLTVIGYQDRISLSLGHFSGERPSGAMEKLLDALVDKIDQLSIENLSSEVNKYD